MTKLCARRLGAIVEKTAGVHETSAIKYQRWVSSKYDLNIIKKYFITRIGAEKQVTMAKKCSCPHPSFWTFVITWGWAQVMRGG